MTRLFNSISVISGRCAGNNEWLCAMELLNLICINVTIWNVYECMSFHTSKIKFKLIELLFRSGRFRLEAGLEPGNARSVGKRLTHWATGAPFHSRSPNMGETFFVLQAHGLFVPSFQTLEYV